MKAVSLHSAVYGFFAPFGQNGWVFNVCVSAVRRCGLQRGRIFTGDNVNDRDSVVAREWFGATTIYRYLSAMHATQERLQYTVLQKCCPKVACEYVQRSITFDFALKKAVRLNRKVFIWWKYSARRTCSEKTLTQWYFQRQRREKNAANRLSRDDE